MQSVKSYIAFSENPSASGTEIVVSIGPMSCVEWCIMLPNWSRITMSTLYIVESDLIVTSSPSDSTIGMPELCGGVVPLCRVLLLEFLH